MSEMTTDEAPFALAAPCDAPIREMASEGPDWRCQRGTGHPGVHEVMFAGGTRMAWGTTAAMRAERGFADDFADEDDEL